MGINIKKNLFKNKIKLKYNKIKFDNLKANFNILYFTFVIYLYIYLYIYI